MPDAQRAARTYGAAADHYRPPALSFWDRFGTATVARLRLAPGGMVLDLLLRRRGVGDPCLPAESQPRPRPSHPDPGSPGGAGHDQR